MAIYALAAVVAIPLKQGQIFNVGAERIYYPQPLSQSLCSRDKFSITKTHAALSTQTSQSLCSRDKFSIRAMCKTPSSRESQSLCSRDKFSIHDYLRPTNKHRSQSLCSRDKFSIARGVFPPCFQSVAKGISNFFQREKVEPSGIVFLRIFHGAYCSGFRGGFQ